MAEGGVQKGVNPPALTLGEKEALREFIQSVGFHRVGFTDAEVLEKERDFLEERGPGPFEPTDLPPRTAPSLLLENARSVVSVALSYNQPDPEKPHGARGRLSIYCRGLDYHELMLERLAKVEVFLAREFGAKSVSFVDTGPPLERAFAEKAGIGKLGKNTNLIAPRLGSWIFLGLLVTDVSIRPDVPKQYSICGSCTLCLDACPTGCLTDWKLDSENCLGYLNQKFAEIPIEHREAMGDWLFGCDICQTVCPHNVKAPSGLIPEFAPLEKPGAFPDLREMVHMSQEQFEAWFLPTAADWRGAETIRRNALVALGNSEEEEAVDILLECLPTGDTLLDEHGRWAARKLALRFPHRAEALGVSGFASKGDHILKTTKDGMSELTRQQFHFELPEELIAQEPAEPRDSSRLLHLDKESGRVSHHVFRDVPDLLGPDICLVVNDSKVIRARLWATTERDETEELFLLRQMRPTRWEVLGSWPEGVRWSVAGVAAISLGRCQADTTLVEFDDEIYHKLETLGEVPLPPYVKSSKGAGGYQTVYAREEGSVAAPTAGLHFTDQVLRKLEEKGVQREAVTLHVGYGTFAEVKDGPLSTHQMHSEWFHLSEQTAEALNRAKAEGKTILTVGTSATRVLESQAKNGVLRAGTGETNLFIYPPYEWQFVDAMFTNFHMPDRSPLMLVAALAGKDKVMSAYAEAIREKYRFYSFGDSMLVL